MATDPLATAIDDARSLLDTLLASEWQDVRVVADDTEIFIARRSGRTNPMLAVADADPAGAEQRATAREEVRALHVATLVEVVPVGTRVAAGDRVAVLRVLDDEQLVTAAVAGRVGACPAAPGVLLDYGATIVVLEIDA